jgi:hypothetical protein
MSENRGKAKAKPTAKSAGKNKAAVMNSRNPKKPMAISGDTMSNYAMYKKGGTTKKYKSGGSFPDLTGDGKVTQADILKGRGVIKKKGGLVKAQAGIWKKEKTINEDGSSMTRRTSNNPITGNTRMVTKTKSADGDKSKSVKISSRQKGGKVSKYQEGGPKIEGRPVRGRNPMMSPSKQTVPSSGPKPSYDTMEPSYKNRTPPQMETAPSSIKQTQAPTSRYTTNDSPAIEYRKKKGGSIKKKYQKGGSTVKQLGTGSKANMVKNLYKKYTKK